MRLYFVLCADLVFLLLYLAYMRNCLAIHRNNNSTFSAESRLVQYLLKNYDSRVRMTVSCCSDCLEKINGVIILKRLGKLRVFSRFSRLL